MNRELFESCNWNPLVQWASNTSGQVTQESKHSLGFMLWFMNFKVNFVKLYSWNKQEMKHRKSKTLRVYLSISKHEYVQNHVLDHTPYSQMADMREKTSA